MTNGNGNSELTVAQQQLLQKFPQLPADDPLVELAAWNASLEHKVDDFAKRLDLWTTAILRQTDLATEQNHLIVSQNLQLQEVGKNNAALGQTLLQFRTDLTQLQEEFSRLKTTISNHGTTLQRSNSSIQSVSNQLSIPSGKTLNGQMQKLEERLTTLEESLNGLPQKLLKKVETLNTKIDNLTQAWNDERLLTRAALFLLLVLAIGQHFTTSSWGNAVQSRIDAVSAQVDAANKNVNTALLRLKRLESR